MAPDLLGMGDGIITTRVVSQRTAGTCAGALLLLGAVVTVTVSVSARGGLDLRPVDAVVAALTVAMGGIALVVPWDRFGSHSTLVLVPVVLAVISFSDYANPDPYTTGLFYVVVAMWLGLFHGRWVTIAFAPLIAGAFWLPRELENPLPSLPAATLVVALVSVLVGEILGALQQRVDATQRQLVASRERRFATLTQGSNDVTLVFDERGTITYASSALTELLGDRPDEVEGRPLSGFLSARVRGLDSGTYDELVRSAERRALGPAVFGSIVDLRLRRLDGRWICCEALAQDRVTDPDIGGVVIHLRDVDARRRLEQRLHHLAYHDELTGLANRLRLRERIEAWLAEDRLEAVVVCSLDGFTRVNDIAGHDAGDELLRAVAQRLGRAVGDTDRLGRLAGDEFAVLVPRGERPEELARAAIDVLGDPFHVGPSDLRIGVSLGIARHDGHAGAEELLRAADTAMHVAKAHPNREVVEYERRMRDELVARLDTEAQIRAGLRRDEFVVQYQPKVDLRSGAVVGVEALARWQHPVRGLVGPTEFIQVAEDTGLIVELGRTVLEQACRDAAQWQFGPGSGCEVAINVSPRQFDDSDVVHEVRSALDATGLDPRLMTVEVTESLLLSDLRTVRRTLEQLKGMGVSLALDDFGTGYASLSYLQQMPFDMLKIDRSFVSNITTNDNNFALVQTITQLGRNLGLQTLAEGIETPEQAQVLAGLGCDFGQGYLYAAPLSLDRLADAWLARWPTAVAAPGR